MEAPRIVNEVQLLIGRLATLNFFVSRVINKCLTFFQILRKAFKLEWNTKMWKSFYPIERLPKPTAYPLQALTRKDHVLVIDSLSKCSQHGPCLRRGECTAPYILRELLHGIYRGYISHHQAYMVVVFTITWAPYFQAYMIVVFTNHPLR